MNKIDGSVPKHVGIVLDGNRRFAKKLMMEPWKGHELGAEKVEKLLSWSKELGIKELTLYSFSMQNINRPKKEFDYLMNLFRKAFTKFKDDPRVKAEKIRVNIIGRLNLLPEDLQQLFKQIMDETKQNNNFVLNFAIAYGGREEIIDAVNKAIAKGEKVDEESFKKYLYSSDEPDLIIRTGGEKRTSNFLPWQSTYSEWFFFDKTWPEFEKEDLVQVIDEFKERERRFGH
ncbi:MAG: polyprenyl diphosphate synthase [archaeon]